MTKIKITNLDNQGKNGSKEQLIFATASLVEELSSEQSSLVVGGHGSSGWGGIVAAPQYGGTGQWKDKL